MKHFNEFSLATKIEDLEPFLAPHITTLAYDTETKIKDKYRQYTKSGIEKKQPMHDFMNANIRLHQFYSPLVNDGKPIILDTHTIPFKETKEFLTKLFWLKENTRIYTHFVMFDGSMLYGEYGVFPKNIVCTQVMSTLFWAGLYQGLKTVYKTNKVYTLANVYKMLFPGSLPVDKELQSSDWSKPQLTTEQYLYASRDTIYCYEIGELLHKLIYQAGLDRVYTHEQHGVLAFVFARVKGMPVCIDTLKDLEAEYQAVIDTILIDLRKAFNIPIDTTVLDEYKSTLKYLLKQFSVSAKKAVSYVSDNKGQQANKEGLIGAFNSIVSSVDSSFDTTIYTVQFETYQGFYNLHLNDLKKYIDRLFNSVDLKQEKILRNELVDVYNNIKRLLNTVFGYVELNPSSPPQMKTALIRLGFDVESTGSAILSALLNDLENEENEVDEVDLNIDYDSRLNVYQKKVLELLILYRSVNTGCKYITSLISCYNPKTKRVHGNFRSMASQGSGRSSCLKPTLQIIPRCPTSWRKLGLRPIRIAFTNPTPGWKIASLDSAGCHPQIARRYSRDETLIYNVQNNKDNYVTLGAKLFEIEGRPMSHDEIKAIIKDKKHPENFYYSELRQAWKKAFLSRLNGSGAKKILSGLLDNDPPIRVYDLEMVEKCCLAFDTVFSGLARCQKQLLEAANTEEVNSPFGAYQNYPLTLNDGRVLTLTTNRYGVARTLDGGRYYLPKFLKAYNDEDIQKARFSVKPTEVYAYSWQRVEGSAVKEAAYQTVMYILNNGLDDLVQLCNINHDELVLTGELPVFTDVVLYANKMIEKAFRLYVPDYIDPADPLEKILDNWQQKE